MDNRRLGDDPITLCLHLMLAEASKVSYIILIAELGLFWMMGHSTVAMAAVAGYN